MKFNSHLSQLMGKIASVKKLIRLGVKKYVIQLIELEEKLEVLKNEQLGIIKKITTYCDIRYKKQVWDSDRVGDNLDRFFISLTGTYFRRWKERDRRINAWRFAMYLIIEELRTVGMNIEDFVGV
ncbi:MAG: hypothetical protein F6K61_21490 [Sphaerospermopsis sp. SIO1G1]|nr:hypothetical protein [Sphaerospermopsis sp. SIO1G1]